MITNAAHFGRDPDNSHGSLFARLGVIGMETVEAVILAALAIHTPLLLIGPRGCGKTMLLMRICMALELEWRLYDASTVSYDDLVGLVRIDGDRIVFVESESSIWKAQIAIVDEVSRARPDMQSKIFGIIWDRRVLGIELKELIQTLSAMNPVKGYGLDDDEFGYLGSKPLDAALADRYAFLVLFPDWSQLSTSERRAIIQRRDEPVDPAVGAELARRLEAIRTRMPSLRKQLGAFVTEYFLVLFDLASTMGLELSGRRAVLLYEGALAVHAARQIVDPEADLDESLWLSVVNGLPQRAEGRPVDEGRLVMAHNEAFKAAGLDEHDPKRLLICEPDPVERAIRAVYTKGLTVEEMTAFVADGLAETPFGGRHALAEHVIRSPATGHLAASVAEDVAELQGLTVIAQHLGMPQHPSGVAHETWQEVAQTASRLDREEPEDARIMNLLLGLYGNKALDSPGAVGRVIESWRSIRRRCRTPRNSD